METGYSIALVTVPTLEVARQITHMLLQDRLAACVNIVPQVNSLYTWQGKICEDQEVLLICKTRAEIFDSKFVPAVQAMHPYDLPEIICLPIDSGNPAYLKWIGDNVVEEK
jgi:periplasmic divalent cation tolerance protein